MEQGDESLGLGRDAELPEAVSLGLVTFGSPFVKTGTNDLGKEKWPVNFETASCQSLLPVLDVFAENQAIKGYRVFLGFRQRSLY